MSLAWAVYRAAAPCLGALLPAVRPLVPPGERESWDERLGRTRAREGVDAWIHVASLGEATAAGPLLRELQALRPTARLLLTATTRGGKARLATLGPPAAVAPLDAPQATAAFFAGVAPRRLFLLETELWPHWLLRARATGTPVAVLSARLKASSLRRYRLLGPRFRELVAGLAAVLCQSEADLERWRRLGARPEVSAVTGNLKDDDLPADAPERGRARAGLGLAGEGHLLVLGSVRPGEVEVLARAWQAVPAALRREWEVVAVPRHPRDSARLRAEAERAGQPVAAAGDAGPGAWGWDERLGVLNAYYDAADVAFVGGSLVPLGGHNPLEPAARGAAVLVGPHHATQREAVRALEAAGALRVASGVAQLAAQLEVWLGDEQARAGAGRAGLAVAARRRGAARRTVAWLAERRLWPA